MRAWARCSSACSIGRSGDSVTTSACPDQYMPIGAVAIGHPDPGLDKGGSSKVIKRRELTATWCTAGQLVARWPISTPRDRIAIWSQNSSSVSASWPSATIEVSRRRSLTIVGQHDPLHRRQPVEQPVHDQQVGLVHAGRGQPRPPGDQLGRGPQRDFAPRPEVEPVQDGGDQQAAVPAGLTRAPRGVGDQAADRDRRPGPDAGRRQADPGPDGRPPGSRCARRGRAPAVSP